MQLSHKTLNLWESFSVNTIATKTGTFNPHLRLYEKKHQAKEILWKIETQKLADMRSKKCTYSLSTTVH